MHASFGIFCHTIFTLIQFSGRTIHRRTDWRYESFLSILIQYLPWECKELVVLLALLYKYWFSTMHWVYILYIRNMRNLLLFCYIVCILHVFYFTINIIIFALTAEMVLNWMNWIAAPWRLQNLLRGIIMAAPDQISDAPRDGKGCLWHLLVVYIR